MRFRSLKPHPCPVADDLIFAACISGSSPVPVLEDTDFNRLHSSLLCRRVMRCRLSFVSEMFASLDMNPDALRFVDWSYCHRVVVYNVFEEIDYISSTFCTFIRMHRCRISVVSIDGERPQFSIKLSSAFLGESNCVANRR